jgi:TPR repeat protein
LGDLLLEPGAGVTDPARATTLYTQAWEAGVPIAASRLGQLYESGTHAAQAWAWYQRGADAGEPASLARLAVRAEAEAAGESTAAKSNAPLLQ